jgi:uncharacterized membrane protein SpoIIM required for sporulation
MLGSLIEAAVVLCVAIGAFAILSVLGLFPDTTLPLLLAVLGAFGGYLYGRHGRRPRQPAAP